MVTQWYTYLQIEKPLMGINPQSTITRWMLMETQWIYSLAPSKLIACSFALQTPQQASKMTKQKNKKQPLSHTVRRLGDFFRWLAIFVIFSKKWEKIAIFSNSTIFVKMTIFIPAIYRFGCDVAIYWRECDLLTMSSTVIKTEAHNFCP